MPIELIKASTASTAPFQVEALVLEEDTGLVLSAESRVKDVHEHPVRLMTDLLYSETIPVGTAVLKEGSPRRILAIVHDMDQVPNCRQEWVVSALTQVLNICRQENLRSVAMQRLGCVYGKQDPLWFEEELLVQSSGSGLQRIWLMDQPTTGQ